MTDRAALLDYADDVLTGTIPLGNRGTRTAALLARCALEDWLDQQSAAWMIAGADRPTTTSKLVALTTLKDAETGESVQSIWNALSRACHHHAYDLQPSAPEIKGLVARVRALDEG